MPSTPAPPVSSRRSVTHDDFVDARIRKTRRAVKSADLATGLVTLLAWGLGLLLVAAVADHWLVAGGFDSWGRFALFAIGLIGALLYIGTRLGPALLGKINPLYAAQQIERDSPDLKNSLLNLLQLRSTPTQGTASVRRTLERQAAERLSAAGETPIDQGNLIRVAQIVLLLMGAIGIYVVASPKDFFASAGRVLAPWADIAAPSRVRLESIEPGDVELAQGDRLEISTMATGLRDDELVEVVYSTRDGRVVDRRVPMTPSRSGGLSYRVTLPPGSGATAALGLQSDLVYHLAAGDVRSRSYEVNVLTAPTIAPVSVTYDYPAYTGYSQRVIEGVGDLQAIEGTRVELTAAANLPIESAQIDLGADGRPEVRMTVNDKQATGVLSLRRDASGASPTNYVLRFTSKDGQANHDPSQYRVEVIADLAPEAAILIPEPKTIDVALATRVRVEIEARDPDFALKSVRLVGKADGKPVFNEEVLPRETSGRFTYEKFFTPAELKLQPGQVLEYWVEATDNKAPQPNKTESAHKQIRIIGSKEAGNDENQGEQQPGRGEGQPQPGEESQEGEPGDDAQPGRNGQSNTDQPRDGDGSSEEGQPQAGGEQSGQNQPKEDGEQDDPGDGREPSPGGLRGPGEGDDSSDSKDEPTSGSPSESGGESGESSDSENGAGNSSSSEGGESGQDDSQMGEQGQSSDEQPSNESGSQQQSEGAEQGNGQSESKPVPRDGEDDATAFERIREFLNNQNESKDGNQSGDQNQNPGDQQQDDRPDGESGRDGQPSERPRDDSAGERSQSSDGAENGQRSQRDDSSQRSGSDEGMPQDGTNQSEPQPRSGDPAEQPERSEEGPGAGEEDRSGQQSESTSSESGDESPPGEASKPDAGPREGTGSSGQNEAADQGAGQSADRGAGDTSGRPGGEQNANEQNGDPGSEKPGEGSSTREGTESTESSGDESAGDESGESGESGGSESAGEAGESSQGESSSESGSQDSESSEPSGQSKSESAQSDDERSKEGAQSDQSSDSQSSSQSGEQSSDSPQGKPSDSRGQPSSAEKRGGTSNTSGEGTEPGSDAANLDYAREQTELVLEKLEDQLAERQVDRELLEKLGWTEQDLQRFVDRWQARQQRAAERGPAGEAELDRALKSLGLSPEGAKANRKISDDELRNLRERARQAVPPRLRERTSQYNRSINSLDNRPAAGGDGK